VTGRGLTLLLMLAAGITSPAFGQGALFTSWRAGMTDAEPACEIQYLGADTVVIRQSITTNFEAPFLYLLIGKSRALLFDSGAGGFALRPVIDAILAARGTPDLPLVVAHSHAHGDHIAGDAELAARPATTVIDHSPGAVAAAFGMAHWPEGRGSIDLGGRRLTIIATPGHEPAHIMIHDPANRLLLTGDTLYPGRLYVPIDQFAVWRASIDRAAAFARRHRLRALLGAHIEMRRTAGEDYAGAALRHPDEHILELPAATLFELQAAVAGMTGEPVRQTHADFIIVPRWPH
jgi:glyoxylase-like metal-dependent hydrolase (beta-lactamase superfamily II)